ncbi:MAG: helix-turn-helix domain-containing protein, partial [Bacteroidota bacterium]
MIQEVGEKIRLLRSSKGLTQANMAEELGMTTSAYSKIERAEINIPLNRLYQIAEVLDVPVMIFFQEEGVLQIRSSLKEKQMNNLLTEVEDIREILKRFQTDLENIKENIQRLLTKKKDKR